MKDFKLEKNFFCSRSTLTNKNGLYRYSFDGWNDICSNDQRVNGIEYIGFGEFEQIVGTVCEGGRMGKRRNIEVCIGIYIYTE